MSAVEISFVIIEYYSLPDVFACAQALMTSCADINIEIFVSSNSMYSLGERERLQNEMKNLKWIFNPTNGGFAYGMNSGLERATGDMLVVANPDTRIKNGSLLEAYSFLMASDGVGMLGPRMVDCQGNVQDSCRPFITPAKLARRLLTRIFKSKNVILEQGYDYTRIQPVDWVIGAFMMVKKSAYASVGGLDQRYFLYLEDMDWCKRFWANGWEVMYYPSLTIEYEGDRKSMASLKSGRLVNKYSWCHLKSYWIFLRSYGLFPVRDKATRR